MKVFPVLIILFGLQAKAELSSSGASALTAAVELVAHYSQKGNSSLPTVAEDEIRGCCFPRGTELILKDTEGKKISQQTVGEDGFKFFGLKPGIYTIEYRYRSFAGSKSLRSVATGKWLTVETSVGQSNNLDSAEKPKLSATPSRETQDSLKR